MRKEEEAAALALGFPCFEDHLSVLFCGKTLLNDLVLNVVKPSQVGEDVRSVLCDVDVFIDDKSVVFKEHGVKDFILLKRVLMA